MLKQYLENTILGIENCENLKELKDIREELVKTGYVKSQKKIGKKEIHLKELKDIREELVKTGYVKSQKKIGKKEIQPSTAPMEFKSSEGYQILVGKNNRQNDYLTLRLADNDDIWMHTKDIPGSHVIVKCAGHEPSDQTLFEAAVLAAYYSKARMSAKVPVDYTKRKNPGSHVIVKCAGHEPSDQTLFEAAVLAAYYSKARMSAKVPVDYTKRKNVKKPSGAKPGMVIYETNNTAYVTPTEEIVAQLKIK